MAAVMVLAACSGTSSSQTVTTVPHVVGMVAVGGMPHFPAVDPGTNHLFVSSLKSASLATVNLSSGQTTTAIPVGMTPHTVMFEQGAERVWVTDLGSDQVSVVDARTMQAAGTVTVGKLPHGLAIDPGHHRAYVTNVADSSVSVIDTTSLAVIQTFVLPEFDGRKAWPWGVSLDAKGGRLYVTATGQLPKPDGTLTSSGSDRLDVLDLNDGHLLSSVVVGAGPWNVAVEENTGTAFVGVTSTNEVVAVKGDRVVGRVKVGDNPHGVVIDPAANRLYVNNAKSNSVSVIDTRGLKVVATVGVGQQPQGIALDSRRHLLYTANQAAGTITVVGLTGGEGNDVAMKATGLPRRGFSLMNRTRVRGWVLVGGQTVLLGFLILGPADHAWSVPQPLRMAGQLLRWVGVGAVAIEALRLGRAASVHPEPTSRAALRTDGPYRFVRHPIYSGVLLFAASVAGTSGSAPDVLAFAALAALLFSKARVEERLLAQRFAGYRAYAEATSRFVPGLRRR